MIKNIVRDTSFLAQKSEPATKKDAQVIVDLTDTLKANANHCVGMAANMIGVKKRILVFSVGPMIIPMVNPVILKKEGPYEAKESCLSLIGMRNTTRYQTIEVEYLDAKFKKQRQIFNGFIAQVIQHEMDHFEGIII